MEHEYIDLRELEDPDEDEVVYVAAGRDNLLYGGLAEEGIIYYEVNRQGSLHPHAHHLAAEQFVQARFVSSEEALFRLFGPQSKAPAP